MLSPSDQLEAGFTCGAGKQGESVEKLGQRPELSKGQGREMQWGDVASETGRGHASPWLGSDWGCPARLAECQARVSNYRGLPWARLLQLASASRSEACNRIKCESDAVLCGDLFD